MVRMEVTGNGRPLVIRPFTDSSDCAADRMELRRRASEDGYVFMRRLFPPDAVLEFARAAQAQCEARGWSRNGIAADGIHLGAYDDERWVAFLCHMTVHPLFSHFALRDETAAVLRQLLDAEPRRTSGDLCRVVSPDTNDLTTRPHQDANYLRESGAWTVWFPLSECPLELGPLAIAPGSHRGGVLPHGEGVAGVDFAGPWCAQDLEPGDAIFFSDLTVHRAIDNVSDALRISVDYRYRPPLSYLRYNFPISGDHGRAVN